MLNSICKGFEELHELSILDTISKMKIIAAQPYGCAPVVNAFKKNTKVIPIENPNTIAKSLAIGDPGDGNYVLKRLKQYHGYAEESNNDEIIKAIIMLAETEGILTEPAGGVSIAVLKKMIEQNLIDKDNKIVCFITGNGLKSLNSLSNVLLLPKTIKSNMDNILTMMGVN